MRAYHIDTNGLINETIKTIDFQKIPRSWHNYENLVKRYPEGLSSWGLNILGIQYQYPQKTMNLTFWEGEEPHWNSYFIDILYEYERLASFSNKNSRFQSIFALKNIEDALSWKDVFDPNCSLYEIEFDEKQLSIHDSTFLHCKMNQFNLLDVQKNAHDYWSGKEKCDDSRPELVIKLPVKIMGSL